jgi:hypothetical protein
MTHRLLAILGALLCGCSPGRLADAVSDGVLQIACVGDSNSDPSAWCEVAAAQLTRGTFLHDGRAIDGPIEWRNFATAGATACDYGLPWHHGIWQRDQAVAWGADVLVIALGTNDWHKPAREAMDCLLALVPPNVTVFFATIPGVIVGDPPLQTQEEQDFSTALNALIRRTIPPTRVIDFDTWMTAAEFGRDGRHVTEASQAPRAAHVLNVLRRYL